MDEAAGFGFGLSITNAIVLAHGGALSLHDRQPHGLVICIRLPVRQQSQRTAAYASGCERVGIGFLVDGDRLEAIVAGAAEPEERRSARTAFNPVGSRNRLAALGTGISAGQIAGIESNRIWSSHGALPSDFFVFCIVVNLNWTGLLSEPDTLPEKAFTLSSNHLHVNHARRHDAASCRRHQRCTMRRRTKTQKL